MKKYAILTTAIMCTIFSANAFAASPIPSFDKEAVKEYPYNRRGQQEVIVDKDKDVAGEYRPGNTGTAEKPAFYIKKINLTGFQLPDKLGELQKILDSYSNRSITVEELQNLTNQVTNYARNCGYTVAQAVVPPQEIADGNLEVKMYIAFYDAVGITKNTSRVADRAVQRFMSPLHSGEVITDKKLESVLNNLNDLPSFPKPHRPRKRALLLNGSRYYAPGRA